MYASLQEVFEHFRHQKVALQRLGLLLVDLPQKEAFKSGIGVRESKKTLILQWVDADGLVGYGECACRPDPYYSAEFLEAAALAIERFIFPHLLQCQNYGEVWAVLQSLRGWHFTKAAVDFAVQDMIRAREGKNMLDYWAQERIAQVPAGISIGLYPSARKTENRAAKALEQGFRRLKFKVNPEFDVDGFAELAFTKQDIPLLFDANGTLQLKDLPLLKKLAALGATIEQPFPPGRMDWCSQAKAQVPGLKICLDEEIKNIGLLKVAHQIAALDELNLKPGRVGGVFKALEMMAFCFEKNIGCWIGGMFETGIGRSMNLQFASFLPQATAHDLSPSSRYFKEDILDQPIEMNPEGYIDLTASQASVEEKILEKYTTKKTVLPHPA